MEIAPSGRNAQNVPSDLLVMTAAVIGLLVGMTATIVDRGAVGTEIADRLQIEAVIVTVDQLQIEAATAIVDRLRIGVATATNVTGLPSEIGIAAVIVTEGQPQTGVVTGTVDPLRIVAVIATNVTEDHPAIEIVDPLQTVAVTGTVDRIGIAEAIVTGDQTVDVIAATVSRLM